MPASAPLMRTEMNPMPEADRALLRQRALRYASQHATTTEKFRPAISFKQGNSAYAVYLSDLREIRPIRKRRAIPGASLIVPGVFHYRGELLSLHDLEVFFSGTQAGHESPWVLIAENQAIRFGILATEVTAVEEIATGQIGQHPITLGEKGACMYGIVNESTLLLNIGALMASPQFFSAF